MRKFARSTPFVINKNLGSADLTSADQLTSTNADNLPVISPTEKQKYDFDRNGWLLIPGVLTEDEVAETRAYCGLSVAHRSVTHLRQTLVNCLQFPQTPIFCIGKPDRGECDLPIGL